ncbi:MAG: glycosyltransferase family 2 protein [Candidatus Omnitrophica bacterium]|nr:glycosyltransferase family 2 protein [Candidatus Omnitrophota bacterium]
MSKKFPLSIVIIAKNEADNIEDCLKSASWADDVVVLDDFSTDATAKIAHMYTERVYERKMDIEGRHRNYAYSLAKNEWVFSLDADERITDELREELKHLLKKEVKDIVFTVPIKAFIGDKWVRHGGWYPGRKVRLFRKDKFKYEEVKVHPRVFYNGTCGHLKNPLLHYSYKDYHEFFQSLNNQTTLEAEKWFAEKRRIGTWGAIRKMIDRFLRAYIGKKGFRDGFTGFIFAMNGGLYQIYSYAKYREMLEREKNK